MKVPLLDLHVLYARQRAELEAAVLGVLASQRFILGPEVAAFEREVSAFLGTSDIDCIGCGSGSAAIVLALRALGVGPGDEVVTPAYSFTSTATSVDLVGATPVFVDVDSDSLNIDAVGVTGALTERTKAVLPVHLYGRSADVPAIRAALDAAGRPDVAIVEDAAQALGARVDGRPVCTMGDIATVSFFPSKNLGAFGDAGLVVTRRRDLADAVRVLRAHGSREKYRSEVVGYNSRLDALQAAVLRVRLPALAGWCEERRTNAARYRKLFADRGLSAHVSPPPGDGPGDRFHHIYNQFNIRVHDGRRDALKEHLADREIGSAIYYPRTLPQQPCYAHLGHGPGAFPNAERACEESLAIPVFPGLTQPQQDFVADVIAEFFGRR